MRTFVFLTVTCVILIGAGSVYWHLDTKQFIKEITKQAPNDTEPNKSSHPRRDSSQSPPVNSVVKQDSQSKEVSKPAWWNDISPNILDLQDVQNGDPWGEMLSQERVEASKTQEESPQKTPIKDLDPNDPYDLYEMMLASYLKKFGDIPEVHILVEGWLKGNLGIIMTPEEELAYLEAMNYLNPHPSTQRSIEMARLVVAGDYDTLIEKYGTPIPESQQPFIDVKPFFEENVWEEGFRLLRASDPKRAAEFEEFLREEARQSPLMNLDEIEGAIQRSYAPRQEK